MTLLELRTLARQMSDSVNSQYVTDAELTAYVNLFYKEIYDELIITNEDFNIKSVTLSFTTSNQLPLPNDFYKARALEKIISPTLERFRVTYFQLEEMTRPSSLSYRILAGNIVLAPNDPSIYQGDYELWYYPTLTQLVNDPDVTINLEGFDELIAVKAANMILAKQEIVNNGLLKIEAEMMQRLRGIASFRSSDEQKIVKVR